MPTFFFFCIISVEVDWVCPLCELDEGQITFLVQICAEKKKISENTLLTEQSLSRNLYLMKTGTTALLQQQENQLIYEYGERHVFS